MDIPPDVITPASLHHQASSKLKAHFEAAVPSKNNQVSTVVLYGIPIVSLVIESQERLCLAQISNTLLKEFSYNEIHNRRVALGITCVQCTPVQLEILRRAGAMPVSSRRCGMITRREAERLCKSFLGDNSPPRLPEDFAFSVYHECAWGCQGAFLPSRYNSSRAKCIKCAVCALFFSPNKFIFHSHRLSTSAKYIQPDAANFNSWRRHMKLLGAPPDDVTHAWEDVKAMFNGGMCNRGTRKRANPASSTRMAARSQPNNPEAKCKQSKASVEGHLQGHLNSDTISNKDFSARLQGHLLSSDVISNKDFARLPTALARISSAVPNLDFWHTHPIATHVPNSASAAPGLKSFPPNVQAAAATFTSMAAMLPAWYYNYHGPPPAANSSAFRPVYPAAYLSGYLGKLSPTSDAEGEEPDDGGEGDTGGEDSDETVDIETCTPEEEKGEELDRRLGGVSPQVTAPAKISCPDSGYNISETKPITLEEDSYKDESRSFNLLSRKRAVFPHKSSASDALASVWTIEKLTSSVGKPSSCQTPSDHPAPKWTDEPDGPMDCSTCHHAAAIFNNNNNNNNTKYQSQN